MKSSKPNKFVGTTYSSHH